MLLALVVVHGVGCKSKPAAQQAVAGSGSSTVAPAGDAAVATPLDAAPTSIDAGSAAAAGIPCTPADIKAARKTADGFIQGKQPEKAVALLESIDCWLTDGQDPALQEQLAWKISDLAFAYYKAGKLEECFKTAESQTEPYPHNVAEVFGEDSKVLAAIAYNADLCDKAVKKKWGDFVPSTTCASDEGEGVYGVPNEIASGQCITFGEPGKDENGDPTCGDVLLIKGGKKTKLAIEGESANLSDPSVCCNIGDLAFQSRKNGWAVLVGSGGRNCMGGTASTSEQHVYELVGGKTLRLVRRLEAAYH